VNKTELLTPLCESYFGVDQEQPLDGSLAGAAAFFPWSARESERDKSGPASTPRSWPL